MALSEDERLDRHVAIKPVNCTNRFNQILKNVDELVPKLGDFLYPRYAAASVAAGFDPAPRLPSMPSKFPKKSSSTTTNSNSNSIAATGRNSMLGPSKPQSNNASSSSSSNASSSSGGDSGSSSRSKYPEATLPAPSQIPQPPKANTKSTNNLAGSASNSGASAVQAGKAPDSQPAEVPKKRGKKEVLPSVPAMQQQQQEQQQRQEKQQQELQHQSLQLQLQAEIEQQQDQAGQVSSFHEGEDQGSYLWSTGKLLITARMVVSFSVTIAVRYQAQSLSLFLFAFDERTLQHICWYACVLACVRAHTHTHTPHTHMPAHTRMPAHTQAQSHTIHNYAHN